MSDPARSSYCDPEILEHLDGPLAICQRRFLDLGLTLHAAVLLSQVMYWSWRTSHRGGWFYKTQREWFAEIGFSRRELEASRRQLRRLGFLEEKRAGLPARLFYRINKECLIRSLKSLKRPDCPICADLTAQPGQTCLPAPRSLDCPPRALIAKNTTEITKESPEREAGALSVRPAGTSETPPHPARVEEAENVGWPEPMRLSHLGGAGESAPEPEARPAAEESQGEPLLPGGILSELETMAAAIRAAAVDELRPAAPVRTAPDSYPVENFSANDPIRVLADEYTRLLLAEFDAGYETFRRRGLDLEASRTGLLCAVVENPEKYRKIRDRRLYVRKWLLNERARLPV